MLSHHAYYFEGSTALLPELEASLAGEGSLVTRIYERFGIDDAHALQYQASLKSDERQVFLVATPSITTEAQQALLKVFEEPQPGVVFVLLVPVGSLLSTLRSRCLQLPHALELPRAATEAKAFLKASVKERSEIIGKLLKDESGAREKSRELALGLEQLLYAELSKANNKKEILASLEELNVMDTYLSDRSPSLKMILEHLAAVLPKL